MILLSYLVILFAGANVYGIISVFIRLQEVFRRLSYGVKSSLSWGIPRYEKENHIGILLSLFSFLIIIWFLVFIFLFYFRGKIITNTIINDSILVVVFSIGLIPYIILLNTEYTFLALRNVRLGMLFSKFVVPVSIILGSLASFFIIKSKESFWIWSSSIGFLTLSSILSVYLLFYTTNYNLSFENFNIKIIKKSFIILH